MSITYPGGSGGATSGTIIGSISQFNPAANGVTDDSAVFTTAAATYDEVWLAPNKSYFIGTNLSLACALVFVSGSKLVIGTGITLTLTGSVQSSLETIFTIQGTGKVVFGANSNQTEVYPEWWGALGDNSHDDTVAIQAAITSVSSNGLGVSTLPPVGAGTVVLQAKTYKVTATVTIAASWVNMRGHTPRSSVLLSNSATADILLVNGTGTNLATQVIGFVNLSDFSVQRSVANTSVTSKGIAFNFSVWCSAERVESWDSYNCFYFDRTVSQGRFKDCQSVSSLGTVSVGFYVNQAQNSSRWIDCASSSGTYGMYMNAPVDAYVEGFEGSGNVGINISGVSGDVFIRRCVFESGSGGIRVINSSGTGVILIDGGYYNNNGTTHILIQNSNNVYIQGGLHNVAGASNAVLINTGSKNCTVLGLRIQVNNGSSTAVPIVIDGTSGTTNNIVTACNISAPVGTPGLAAIYLYNSTLHNVVIGNLISGYWTEGIHVESNSLNNTVLGNKIDPTHVTTPMNSITYAVQVFANNAAAITGGLSAGDVYRTNADPDTLCIVH